MTLAIELTASQALALSDAAARLQVPEAELAAAAVRDLWPNPARILMPPPNGSSPRTRSCIAAWPDALAPTGRGAGVTPSAD